MDEGTPHCSVFELPLGMPGLKEFGEREGIKEGMPWTAEQWRKLFSFMSIDPLEWAGVRLSELTAGAATQANFAGASFGDLPLNFHPVAILRAANFSLDIGCLNAFVGRYAPPQAVSGS
jgi:hypothetical protein